MEADGDQGNDNHGDHVADEEPADPEPAGGGGGAEDNEQNEEDTEVGADNGSEADAQDLTFGTYNTQRLSLEPGILKDWWQHVRREAPVDILAVQEVQWPQEVEAEWCEYDLDGATLHCARPVPGNMAVAIAINARQGIKVTRRMARYRCAALDICIMRASRRGGSACLRMVCVHAPHTRAAEEDRRRTRKELLNFCVAHSMAGKPVCVAGDLNAEPWWPLDQRAGSARFAHTWREILTGTLNLEPINAATEGAEHTWENFDGSLKRKYDWILLGRQWWKNRAAQVPRGRWGWAAITHWYGRPYVWA